MKRKKGTAFLIAVRQKREAVRVYAVIAHSENDALDRVRALATGGMQVEITGSPSRDLVRRLDLKPGEIRLI
jgi:hypothetical protein